MTRRRALWLALGAGALLGLVPPVAPASAEQDPGFERALLAAINQVRAQHRLRPVRIDPRLTAAARDYARELAERRSIEHTGRDGRHVNDRVDRQGYVWGFVAENLARGADVGRLGKQHVLAVAGAAHPQRDRRARVLGAAREVLRLSLIHI